MMLPCIYTDHKETRIWKPFQFSNLYVMSNVCIIAITFSDIHMYVCIIYTYYVMHIYLDHIYKNRLVNVTLAGLNLKTMQSGLFS